MDPVLQAELQQRLLATHPLQLVSLLADALMRDGYVVDQNVRVHDTEVDLVASLGSASLVIEVKRLEMIRVDNVDRVVGQLSRYPRPAMRVLAFPGVASESARERAMAANLDLWQMDRWADLLERTGVAAQVLDAPDRRPRVAVARDEFSRKGSTLRERLASTPSGDQGWVAYQNLTADIAEFLFSPGLGAPDRESEDAPRRNRRDFVMENVADAGFWLRARHTYNADYVVFDAKNYVSGIPKRCVTDMAHYLKPYGLGMFGIIFTRQEASKAALAAIREQWAGSRRMIAVLSDELTLDMLEKKQSGTAPESRISEGIATLRKSM